MRGEVLFAVHRIPYPPDKGDKIRSFRILEFLSQHFDVHLVCFVDDPADMQHEEYLRTYCKTVGLVPLNRRMATLASASGFLSGEPLSLCFYRSKKMDDAVAAACKRPLRAKIAFSSTMFPYIEGRQDDAAQIVDLCDADSMKWLEYAETKPFPLNMVYRREGQLLGKYELEIIKSADLSFAISPAELSLFDVDDDGKQKLDWFSNGVNTDYFQPAIGSGSASPMVDVVFTGAMDYWANVEAVLWFAREVWPLVRASRPKASFAIVGSNPAKELMEFSGKEGTVVTGRVADIRPWLAASCVSVAPMRIARGIQNKVLEAMASGVPVVATTAGATGIDITPDEHFLRADSASEFAASVMSLLDHKEHRQLLASAARRQMVVNYSWPHQLKRLEDGLMRLGVLASPEAAS